MNVKPGDVVVLKSGGHALTVAAVNDQQVECVWIGEEGDLYRETLPLVVLESAVLSEEEHDESEDHEEDESEDEDDEEEEERNVA